MTEMELNVNCGYNLAVIFNCLNWLRISRLEVFGIGLSHNCLNSMMRNLCSLVDLRLCKMTLIDDWQCFPETLKSMTLTSCQTGEKFLKSVVENIQLTTLHVISSHWTSELTENALGIICKSATITDLKLFLYTYAPASSLPVQERYSIKHIAEMSKLKNLSLSHRFQNSQDRSSQLNFLWENLQCIEKLELSYLVLPNNCLRKIHLLCNLKKLALVYCACSTSACFLHIKLLHTLETFEFCADMYDVSSDVELYDKQGDIECLNQLSSLRNVIIHAKYITEARMDQGLQCTSPCIDITVARMEQGLLCKNPCIDVTLHALNKKKKWILRTRRSERYYLQCISP